MKKFASLIVVFTILTMCAYVVASCLDGNDEYTNPYDPSAPTWCCKPVGDGTVLSCTDGKKWFNVYPL